MVLRVAFITGRSDASSSALSPAQTSFLEAIAQPGVHPYPINFPYLATSTVHRRRSLIGASASNARDYWLSRRDGFRELHRPTVCRMLDEAPHTLLLAGSCGLELLANLELPAATLQHVSVFAYGPVARTVPACRLITVQGRRDRLSQLFLPRATHLVDCGHLDYLSSPDVVALCMGFVANTSALMRGYEPGAAVDAH